MGDDRGELWIDGHIGTSSSRDKISVSSNAIGTTMFYGRGVREALFSCNTMWKRFPVEVFTFLITISILSRGIELALSSITHEPKKKLGSRDITPWRLSNHVNEV